MNDDIDKMKEFLDEYGVLCFFALVSVIIVSITMAVVGLRSTGDGKISGKLTDVSWEGRLVDSCEVGIQYGDQSSRVEFLSSRSREFCDELKNHVGEKYTFTYNIERFSLTTDEREIVTKWELNAK